MHLLHFVTGPWGFLLAVCLIIAPVAAWWYRYRWYSHRELSSFAKVCLGIPVAIGGLFALIDIAMFAAAGFPEYWRCW